MARRESRSQLREIGHYRMTIISVKFTSFSGDEKVLYDALKSGEAGNKVHQIEETKGIEIVLADFLPQQVQKGISWEKNRMTVREEMPEGAGVLARVWMQFPMPKEEATRRWQELSKLRAMKSRNAFAPNRMWLSELLPSFSPRIQILVGLS